MGEPSTTIAIGRVEVAAILDLEADDAPMTESFPGAPAAELLALRDRYPAMYGPNDEWHLFARVWLLRHPGGLLLFDTGVGPAAWAPEPGRLHAALVDLGVAAADVDTVAISHVHDDHIGGTVAADGEPAFPNARYVIQTADVAALRSWAADDEEQRDIWDRLLQPLLDAGAVDEVEGPHPLTDLLRLEHAPGHTPGHQILHVEDGGERLVITADTWNHPGQLAHPEWPSAPDADRDAAAERRRILLPRLAAEPAPIVAPTHFGEPFGHLVVNQDGRADWRPLPR